jgi:hypothetical protein
MDYCALAVPYTSTREKERGVGGGGMDEGREKEGESSRERGISMYLKREPLSLSVTLGVP